MASWHLTSLKRDNMPSHALSWIHCVLCVAAVCCGFTYMAKAGSVISLTLQWKCQPGEGAPFKILLNCCQLTWKAPHCTLWVSETDVSIMVVYGKEGFLQLWLLSQLNEMYAFLYVYAVYGSVSSRPLWPLLVVITLLPLETRYAALSWNWVLIGLL